MKLIGKKKKATVIVKNVPGTAGAILEELRETLIKLGVTEVIIK